MPTDYARSPSLSPESTLSLWREGGALPGSASLESGAATVRSSIVGLDPCNSPLRLNCSFKRIPFMRWKSVTHYSKVVEGLDKSFRAECSTLHSESQVLKDQVAELRAVVRAESANDELATLVEHLQTQNLQQQLHLRQALGEVDSVTRRFSARLQHSLDKQQELQGLVDALKNLESQGLQTTVQELVTENRRLQKQLERSSERGSSSRDRSQSRESNSLAPIVAQLELSKAMLQSQVDELKETLANVEADWAAERSARSSTISAGDAAADASKIELLQAQLEEAGIKLQNSQLLAANACTEAEKYQMQGQLEAHKAALVQKKLDQVCKEQDERKDELERVTLELDRLSAENSFLTGNELVMQHELRALKQTTKASKASVAVALGSLRGWRPKGHPQIVMCVANWKANVRSDLATSSGVEIDRALLLRCKLMKVNNSTLSSELDWQCQKSAWLSLQLGALEHATQTELLAEYEAKEALGEELGRQMHSVAEHQQGLSELVALNNAGLAELNDTRQQLAESQARQPEAENRSAEQIRSLEKTVTQLQEQLKDYEQIHEEAQHAVQALEAQDAQIRQLQLDQQLCKRLERQLAQANEKLEAQDAQLQLDEQQCKSLERQLAQANEKLEELEAVHEQKMSQMEAIVENEKENSRWQSISEVVEGFHQTQSSLQSRGLEDNLLMQRLQCEVPGLGQVYLKCQVFRHLLTDFYNWGLDYGFCRWRDCVIIRVALAEMTEMAAEMQLAHDMRSEPQAVAAVESAPVESPLPRLAHVVQLVSTWRAHELLLGCMFALWRRPVAPPGLMTAVAHLLGLGWQRRQLTHAFVVWRECILGIVTMRLLQTRESATTEAFQELISQLECAQYQLRCSSTTAMYQVACLILGRALRRNGFQMWREHVAADVARTAREMQQSQAQQGTENTQRELVLEVEGLNGWLKVLGMRASRSLVQWVAVSWMRTQLARALALWASRPLLQHQAAKFDRCLKSFNLRRRHVHLLRGFFSWKDCVCAKMLLEDLGSVETLKEQQGEILFEYIAMANRRRRYETRLLWGFTAWREVTLCENAWHHGDVLLTRFRKNQLAGCVALWSAEASRRVTVRKMHQECEMIAVQTHEIETRFSRVNRSKQSLQHQALTAQAEALRRSQHSVKAAQQLVIWMLLWMGDMMLHWGMEGWLRGVAQQKLQRASGQSLRRKTSVLLQLAMERWSCQARRLAEQTAFEMQLFQTKSQLAGAYKGLESIQPLISEAEHKARMESGAQRTAMLLLRRSAVGKGKALAHWRERVAGRVLVSRLLTQVIDDPIVEHGLRHMFLSWQEANAAELAAAHGSRSGIGVDVPQEWMEGVSRMSSQQQAPKSQDSKEAKREEALKAAAIRIGQWSRKHT